MHNFDNFLPHKLATRLYRLTDKRSLTECQLLLLLFTAAAAAMTMTKFDV